MSSEHPFRRRTDDIASDLRNAVTELSGEGEMRRELGKQAKDLERRFLLAVAVFAQSAGENAGGIDYRSLLDKLDDLTADMVELAAELAVAPEEDTDDHWRTAKSLIERAVRRTRELRRDLNDRFSEISD